MNNPSGKKLEKLVFGMFDQMVEGADKYITEQGSTWLIFTKEKKWVVEFTNDKTLWFNYNLFKSELELIGKDCTEERDFIKNWYESRFLGIKPVEDTIQNGVKDTQCDERSYPKWVEDTIQNGVRHTGCSKVNHSTTVEDTIQNGVRHTSKWCDDCGPRVEDTIQNGVRHTVSTCKEYLQVVEDTIQNRVRRTSKRLQKPFRSVKDVIQNGVKETRFQKSSNLYRIEDTRTLWGKSGDEGVVEYIIQEGVKDIIEDSYPHKHRVEGVIRNTNKDGI